MASVLDVASYILDRTGDVSTMKLQKLVYYSQAYHLVRTGHPLFTEHIEAWANGPVVPRLFAYHKGAFIINKHNLPNFANSSHISDWEGSSIDRVVQVLGHYTGAQLSELTHAERPWRNARKGLAEGSYSQAPITIKEIQAFYASPSCVNPLFA